MTDSTLGSQVGNEDARESAKKAAYRKAYYLANKARILAQCKEYRERNKEQKRASGRAYYEANKQKFAARSKRQDEKEKRLARYARHKKDEAWLEKKRQMDRFYSRQYGLRHPKERKATQKLYRSNNPAKCRESRRKCILKNPEAHKKRAAESSRKHRAAFKKKNGVCYATAKRKTDPVFALVCLVRNRTFLALQKQNASKCARTLALLGCTAAKLCDHIQSLFAPGMAWENRGEWHIDHIIPLSKFDLRDREQQAAAFHYTNLQPLWAEDNLRKSTKVPGQNLFGFAYAAKIAEGMTPRRQHGRSKDATRQHGNA